MTEPAEAARKFRAPPKKFILGLYQHGLAPVLGRMILLLTTTGRVSGLPRVTPLQYEQIEGVYYLGSAGGTRADWVKNILADPRVKLQVKNKHLAGRGEVVTDPLRIADFIAYRLERHPRMIGAILKMDGLSAQPSRTDLLDYAQNLALVIVTPVSLEEADY